MCGPYKDQATQFNVTLSKRWINFVHKRCEPGRGLKPKWANNGVEFLLCVCEPQNVAGFSDDEFKVSSSIKQTHYIEISLKILLCIFFIKDFKQLVENCIVYIIGKSDDSSSSFSNSNVIQKKRHSSAMEGRTKILKTEKPVKSGNNKKKNNFQFLVLFG